jgi:murein DD-endopeptidase MepM/ murein hydrolase activator NlpD
MSFQFPKTHLMALVVICGALALLSSVDIGAGMSGTADSTSREEQGSGPESTHEFKGAGNSHGGSVEPSPTQQIAVPESSKVIEHTIRRGDSLALVFSRYGFHPADLHQIATIKPEGNNLRNILPGKRLKFQVDDHGALEHFSYASSPLESVEFERTQTGGFKGYTLTREAERNSVYRFGRIDQSLFLSAQRSGLSDALIMELAKIFQWDIDFALDLRRGDEFSLILEELYLDGRFIGHGNILAAEFVNQGEVFRAVRYETEQYGAGYYLPDGKSLRKAFLRAPLEFSRISSNFNPSRIHPLFKRSMPHRGIDYAAPTGTPIRASGSGRIQIAGKSPSNGNYLVIQHNAEYQTKYLHLSRFGKGIRPGSRVRQGDVIGYVGATGWATAPHLHYEFLMGGVHQNPRTVKLPNDAPLEGKEMLAFHAHAKPLLFQLDAYRQGPQVASAR